jgi:hypothetical protein
MSGPRLLDLFQSRAIRGAGCWLWSGPHNPEGYGRLYAAGAQHYAHRLAYELLVGPIPEGLEIDHLCQNPGCCNPKHLEPVTHAENQRRIAERTTACRRMGHDWTDPRNVRTRKNGRRYCAECDRIGLRIRYAARRAAS